MPLACICLSCASVTSLPCSMESAPASIAVCMLLLSTAWTATLRCWRCASSTTAASSGTVRFSSAETLITSTFWNAFCRTACRARSAPSINKNSCLKDSVGKGWIEILNVRAARDQFASGSHDSRTRDTAGLDRVPQFCVAVNTRMNKVANRGDTALQVFASQLCGHQSALTRGFDDSQQHPGSEQPILMAVH